MFLKTLPLFTLLLLTSAFAVELDVAIPDRSYKLTFTKKNIEFKAAKVDLNFTSKKCNQRILKRFYQKIQKAMSKDPIHKSFQIGYTQISKDGDSYYINPKSEFGKWLHIMPEEIYRLKFEEKFACEPPKKKGTKK